jgi:penicillin amidase
VAFEAFTAAVLDRVYPEERQTRTVRHWSSVSQFLADDLAALDAGRQRQIVVEAIETARTTLSRFSSWGDMHQHEVSHLLGGIPVLGRRFSWGTYPANGSRETVLKTDHPITADRSGTRYGSQSRHISSMDDPDHNWFVLLGGQDGWLGSANLTDQVELWFAGEYVQLPLRPETVKRQFEHVMVLQPARGDRAP